MEGELEEKGITKESTISGGFLVLQNPVTSIGQVLWQRAWGKVSISIKQHNTLLNFHLKQHESSVSDTISDYQVLPITGSFIGQLLI